MQSAQKRRNVVGNSILQAAPDVHPFVFVPLPFWYSRPQLGLRFKGEDTKHAYVRVYTEVVIKHRERYEKSVSRLPMPLVRFLDTNRSYSPRLGDLSRVCFFLTTEISRISAIMNSKTFVSPKKLLRPIAPLTGKLYRLHNLQ